MNPQFLRVSHEGLQFAVLVGGTTHRVDPKTANAMVRYFPERVGSLVDTEDSGRTSSQILAVEEPIPVVADLQAARRLGSNALLIGIAPIGGRLPQSWRHLISLALEWGWPVWSGLHSLIQEDEEFLALSRSSGSTIVDLRWTPPDLPVATARAADLEARVVLTVGSDCNVGKMTAAWELARELNRRGERASFVATGQTGILLSGWGLAVDRVPADFVAGAAESLVLEAAREADWIVVEGQGSLIHPGYSAVTLGLLHGTVARSLILCDDANRDQLRHVGGPLPSIRKFVELYEEAASWVRPASVVGLAVNTVEVDEAGRREYRERVTHETNLPSCDVVRDGAGLLVDALLAKR